MPSKCHANQSHFARRKPVRKARLAATVLVLHGFPWMSLSARNSDLQTAMTKTADSEVHRPLARLR